MRTFMLTVAMLLGFATSALAESVESMMARTVWNPTSAQAEALDYELKKPYGDKYIFADFEKATFVGYESPVLKAGRKRLVARDAAGTRIYGYVLVVFIVTVAGEASDPHVIKASSPELAAAAVESLKTWRFSPGLMQGKPIAVLAGEEFVFAKGQPDA